MSLYITTLEFSAGNKNDFVCLNLKCASLQDGKFVCNEKTDLCMYYSYRWSKPDMDDS